MTMTKQAIPKTTMSEPASMRAELMDWTTLPFRAATEYAADFWQRSLIFLDILRQSGNQQAEMTSRPISPVLMYDYEVVVMGTSLPMRWVFPIFFGVTTLALVVLLVVQLVR